ncbi:MAG: DUF1150 family protein [Yoonia sp.]|nr:DUF1150 family protein [Yoonia sp.]
MNTKFDLAAMAAKTVYVKPIEVADLSDELREQAGDLEQLFAVHNAKGEQLALVATNEMAVHLALENDMQPVALH